MGEDPRPQLKEVANVQNAAITQMLLPSAQDAAQNYAGLRATRGELGGRAYLALLRACEEELHAAVAQLSRLTADSDFLLYKPAGRARKLIVGKHSYHLDYAQAGWRHSISYAEFEKLDELRRNRTFFLQKLKEIFRNLNGKKYLLDERLRVLEQQGARAAAAKLQKTRALEQLEERMAGKPARRLFFF